MYCVRFFFIVGFLPFFSYSQYSVFLDGSGIGYANTNSALKQSFSALDFNPASTLELRPVLFTLGSYTSQKVQLLEAGAMIPFHSNHATGIKIARYGILSYQELLLSALYSYQIISKTILGIRGSYYHLTIPEYSTFQTFFFDIGILSQFHPNLTLGGVIKNVNRARIESQPTNSLPSSFELTLAYELNQWILFLIGVEKDNLYPLEYKACLRYQWHTHFQSMLGYQWYKQTIDGGISLLFQQWQLNFNVRYSWIFGLIPQVNFLYFLPHKTSNQKANVN